MTMQSDTDPTNKSPIASTPLDRTATNLGQIEAALEPYDDAPYVEALLEVCYSIRRAIPFTAKALGDATRAFKAQGVAAEAASNAARLAVPVRGYMSASEQASALDAAGARAVGALWSRAMEQTLTERVDRARDLATAVADALFRAKASLDVARAQLADPLAMRVDVTGDVLARVALLRDELAEEKPTNMLATWEAHATAKNEEVLNVLALALLPMLRVYKSQPQALEKFRAHSDLTKEKAAADDLLGKVNEQRKTTIPPAFTEAVAAYARLVGLYNSTFTKPSDRLRDAPDEVDGQWLRRTIGTAPVPR